MKPKMQVLANWRKDKAKNNSSIIYLFLEPFIWALLTCRFDAFPPHESRQDMTTGGDWKCCIGIVSEKYLILF